MESLDPLKEQEPLKIEITMKEIVDEVVKNLTFFHETLMDETKYYFGIKTNIWFADKPIYLEDVMKSVDFGDMDHKPLSLFTFVFRSFEANFDLLYQTFTGELIAREEKEEDSNVNN